MRVIEILLKKLLRAGRFAGQVDARIVLGSRVVAGLVVGPFGIAVCPRQWILEGAEQVEEGDGHQSNYIHA